MKKLIVTILALVVVLSLSVCAFAAPNSFDPTLDIATSADGTTITVTMNNLPDGVSAELTIPCEGWDGATVKDAGNNTVTSTFANEAVTFAAEGGTYTITKETNTNTGGGNGGGNQGGNQGGTGTGTGGNVGGNTGNIGGDTTTSGTSGSTTTTTVESNKTFDAGIALYGAMAVLAATGSAMVIGKKRKN